MKLIRHKLREVSSMIVYVNCIIKSYYFCLQHPQTILSACIFQVMMKVDLEDVTSRQVTRNNIYFDTIESFSLFSLSILGSRQWIIFYFSLFLSIPFLTFQSPPPYFPLSLSSSNPTSFLLFYSTSSNITLLMSQSFLSTLFILSHSILFPSHSPSSPILFSFTFFSSVYHSITHPFPSSLLSILLASCPNPSSYYSLLILSLSCTVFIIYVSSVFIHLYPYHLLTSSNLLDCSMDWTAQLLAFNSGQRK